MKVMFDTNVYISFIRNRAHSSELQQRGTTKYLSAVVLMELWAGSRNRRGARLLQQLQKPYMGAGRIVTLTSQDYIKIGEFFSVFPAKYDALSKKADFLNDVQIAHTAVTIGATLYTENIVHFDIIAKFLTQLKVAQLICVS